MNDFNCGSQLPRAEVMICCFEDMNTKILPLGKNCVYCTSLCCFVCEKTFFNVLLFSESEFKDIENYLDHWLPLLLMDGIYNAVKDTANSTIFQNVAVTFDDTGMIKLVLYLLAAWPSGTAR